MADPDRRRILHEDGNDAHRLRVEHDRTRLYVELSGEGGAPGLGSYIYTNVNPALHSANGFQVPNAPGVTMHDMVTISLNKAGTIDHVINGVCAPVTPTDAGPSDVISISTVLLSHRSTPAPSRQPLGR